MTVAAASRRRAPRWTVSAVLSLLVLASPLTPAAGAGVPGASFSLARLQYGGGGDWYGNPSSLPNLLAFVREQTTIPIAAQEARVAVMERGLARERVGGLRWRRRRRRRRQSTTGGGGGAPSR